jgi:hypothetical protein
VISSTEAKCQIAVHAVLHQRQYSHRRDSKCNRWSGGHPCTCAGSCGGGFAGVIAGKGLGNLEGKGVALLINDKETARLTGYCSLYIYVYGLENKPR